ncbi:hypothetical protein ACKGJO_14550 [Gracilimonas sp. Q87]|uniref:hypothetical protein n=1 Tax=Gracilimonas sp. Q87 TaxID=3384766 RepID=UPI0039846009
MKFSIRRINEWLILVMIVVLVPIAFGFVQNNWDLLPNEINYLFNIHPTTVITGLATVDAINIFSGETVAGFSVTWRTASIYFNVILYLMLGPFLFFKGFKKAKSDPNRAKPWYWYIGCAICIGSLMVVPKEINHMRVLQNTEAGAEKNRQRDMMRVELAEVGFAAAEYEIIEDGINESFKIEYLDLQDLKYDHSVESIQSDTLLVISVSNPEQPELGHVMEVRPHSESVLRIRN